MQPSVICLMGPTASGKTELSLFLAEQLNCELISVDSAMVYEKMDIGTAKPSLSERARITHHLIDLCDPSQPYSAAQFQRDAHEAIELILKKGKTPLLVGGTMLYFKALQNGLSPLPCADPAVRSHLVAETNQVGLEEMYARLLAIDPHCAQRIDPKDPQRIQRALEVYHLTGQPLSVHWQQKGRRFPYHFVNIALIQEERKHLHDKIALRFEQMLQRGLIDEVEQLYRRGDLHSDLPAIRSVGYRQIWHYLSGIVDFEMMKERAIIASRQLAKRQLTWLRPWPNLIHFESMSHKCHAQVLNYLQDLGTNL